MHLKAGVLTIPRSKHGEARPVPLTSDVRALRSRRPQSLDACALIIGNHRSESKPPMKDPMIPKMRSKPMVRFRSHDHDVAEDEPSRSVFTGATGESIW